MSPQEMRPLSEAVENCKRMMQEIHGQSPLLNEFCDDLAVVLLNVKATPPPAPPSEPDARIHDLIDKWHSEPRTMPLHEWLGMTWEQYSEWLTGKKPGAQP